MAYLKRYGKKYYEIQKELIEKYSGTGPRVIITLGPTPYSKGPVPCSEAQAWGWGVCFNFGNHSNIDIYSFIFSSYYLFIPVSIKKSVAPNNLSSQMSPGSIIEDCPAVN